MMRLIGSDNNFRMQFAHLLIDKHVTTLGRYPDYCNRGVVAPKEILGRVDRTAS